MNAGTSAANVRYSWPRRTARGSLIGLLTICSLTACGRGVPVVDTAPRPGEAAGTISGTIRGPEGTIPVDGRMIEIVNLDTGEQQRVTTNTTGGFSFKVKPGKYRVELRLRNGEALVRKPGVIDLTDLNRSNSDTRVDFALGTGRVSRPRGPAYRKDDGLGSPIA